MSKKPSSSSSSTTRGRDSRNGQFVTKSETKRRPSTTVTETVKPKKK